MSAALNALHFIFGLVVLAEALNKLERIDLLDGQQGLLSRLGGLTWTLTPWRWKRVRIVLALKALAWALLAIGGAGALITPMLSLQPPTFQDVAVIGAAALFIVRTRLKETL